MNNRILSVLLGIALLPVAASAEVPQNPRYIAFILDDFRDHEPSWLTADNIAATPRSVNAPENPELRVDVMATFSVLNFKIGDEKTLTDSVSNYLKASQGGNYPPFDQHIPYRAAFHEWATPAWSFCFRGPQESGDVAGYLKRAGRTRWAASDGYWAGKSQAKWEANLERILRFEDCRFVAIQGEVSSFCGPVRKRTLFGTERSRPQKELFPVAMAHTPERVFGIVADSPAFWGNRCDVLVSGEPDRRIGIMTGDGSDPPPPRANRP